MNKLKKSLFFSLAGLRIMFSETSFQIELALSVITIPLALWFGGTPERKSILIAVILLILIVEILNSAIEKTIDRVGLEYHKLSEQAKDIGSAAVFLSVINAAIVWIILFTHS